MSCETQHEYAFHNRRQLRHVCLNIIIVSSILMKHNIKYENVLTNSAVQ